MGNRFLEMAGYHALIKAHGILGAIVFIGIVPSAILIARFYGRNPFWALRLHIWLQILTLLLTTVVFTLGFFAVGPARSLTNPHHGIGLALYVLVIWQVIGGWLTHRRSKGRRLMHVPLTMMLHQWMGRMVAGLGIAQVALGLTLYGSPLYLFILYALAVFAIFLIYFILSYLHERRVGRDYDSNGSYISESEVISDRRSHSGVGRSHSGLGRAAGIGAAGLGLAALGNRFRNRNRSASRSRVTATESRPESGSFIEDEKYDHEERRGIGHTIRNLALIAGAAALAKRIFSRKRDRDDDTESGHYRPAVGGTSTVTDESFSNIDDGPRPTTPGRQSTSHPMSHGRTTSSVSYDSFISDEGTHHGHSFRDTVAAIGFMAAVRELWNERKRRREDRRVEELRQQEMEEESIARANSQRNRLNGNVYAHEPIRRTSMTSTEITASDATRPVTDPVGSSNLPTAAAAGAAGAALADHHRHAHASEASASVNPTSSQGAHLDVPPVVPLHGGSSASSIYSSGHSHPGRHAAEAAAAGAALGAAAESRRHRHSSRSSREEHAQSPPVSVKVKMHNDGRHVTLRRLTEEEAAASRQARRQERRRRRAGSASSISGGEGSERWRRTEARERREAEEMAAASAAAAGATSSTIRPVHQQPYGVMSNPSIHAPSTAVPGSTHGLNVPPPPPIPAESVTSPGTVTGESSMGDYADNRRRRRAERAQARLAREQQQRVEFE